MCCGHEPATVANNSVVSYRSRPPIPLERRGQFVLVRAGARVALWVVCTVEGSYHGKTHVICVGCWCRLQHGLPRPCSGGRSGSASHMFNPIACILKVLIRNGIMAPSNSHYLEIEDLELPIAEVVGLRDLLQVLLTQSTKYRRVRFA